MKKLTALIASAAITAVSLTAFPASADTDDTDKYGIGDYSPKLYFTAKENDDITILSSGKIYYNTSAVKNDHTNVTVNAYIQDEKKYIGGFIARWTTDPQIGLENLRSPEAEYGFLPYKITEKYYKIGLTENKTKHFMNVYYPQLSIREDNLDNQFFFDTTGENSDDSPFAIFDAVLSKDIKAGNYSIDYIRDNLGGTNMIYMMTSKDTKEFVPDGTNTKSLSIGITDRLLGDIDNNGVVDGSDATLCLKAFGNALSSGDTGLTEEQEVCADVDGNGVVDGSDATLILKYFSYQLSFGDTDFNELIKKDLNKN